MRLTAIGPVLVVSMACAHAPARRDRPQTEDYVVRSVWYAIRVSEPAATYEVELPPGMSAKRVLKEAASLSSLVAEGSTTLRRAPSTDEASGQVRIRIAPPQWTTTREALVPFSLEGSASYSCSVRVSCDTAQGDSWSFGPMGEEHC
jgi:hypothetical protein